MISPPPSEGPKIVKWDIETSPLLVATFGLFDQNIPLPHIIHDWFIICASWQWVGQDNINSVKLTDFPKPFKKNFRNDYHVVKALHDMLLQADIVIAQNGDSFDMKKTAARAIKHDLPPLPKIPSIDTLKEARKTFKFTSNKLDYLGQFLTGDAKMDNPSGLWIKAMNGDKDAIDQMSLYCDQDVVLLGKIYDKLKPHMKSHPNMNVFNGTLGHCTKCNSTNVKKSGFRYTGAKAIQRFFCNSCHSWF